MIKRFKYFALCLSFSSIALVSNAQEGIDTALFKGYGVKKMTVFVKLPLLPNKSMNDSCKTEVYEFDTLERITYENNILSCYGWSGTTAKYHTYDSLNRLIFTKELTENAITFSKFSYNSKGDMIRLVQTRPDLTDSFVLKNEYSYNKKGKVIQQISLNIYDNDTDKYITKYEYDAADNVKIIWTYTATMQLVKKETYDITPISKKLLEFSTETKLPKEKFTRAWNYYNLDAQMYRTQYSNNTWNEYVYKENGLLDQVLNYNMEGKLSSHKTYFYEFHEKHK
jgi:hypothetical protein